MNRALLFLPVLLAACATLVPGTVARLAAMDPLTADPAAIEVVLVLPPGLRVSPGSARLMLAARQGARTVEGAFVLAETTGAPEGIAAPPGGRASLFRLAPADLGRMREVQETIALWKAGAAEATAGSLGVGLGGCAVGAGPAPDARASVLIRTEAGPFHPLVRDARVVDLVGPEVFAQIGPCNGVR